ncbi:MAG TPA: hypothetical protein VII58_14390 [Acidobacteriaceae bacterium]
MAAWSKSHSLLPVVLLAAFPFVHGQNAAPANLPAAPEVARNGEAPPVSQNFDPPSPVKVRRSDASAGSVAANVDPRRPFLRRVVPAGNGPEVLTAGQKFELAFRDSIGLGALGSSLLGTGEDYLFNIPPHYGTDGGAFGEHLGAVELTQAMGSLFSYGLYASAFHEDPHYYVMGPGHSIRHRAIYSATRVVLTQTDAGETRINWAKLAGGASAAALANAYYPAHDREVGPTIGAFASGLGISALSLELHEFWPDVKRMVLHRHRSAQ